MTNTEDQKGLCIQPVRFLTENRRFMSDTYNTPIVVCFCSYQSGYLSSMTEVKHSKSYMLKKILKAIEVYIFMKHESKCKKSDQMVEFNDRKVICNTTFILDHVYLLGMSYIYKYGFYR